jgi:hypothetical protein
MCERRNSQEKKAKMVVSLSDEDLRWIHEEPKSLPSFQDRTLMMQSGLRDEVVLPTHSTLMMHQI